VEVNPEEVGAGSASETNASQHTTVSQKSKRLQWVITKVDNGNLHRPRPAYYGPSEEESSDSAMDMDRSDMEIASPPAAAPCMDEVLASPEVRTQEPMSPIQQEHYRQWTPAIPCQREEDESRARRKLMADIQVQLVEMKTQFDVLYAQHAALVTAEAKYVQQRNADGSQQVGRSDGSDGGFLQNLPPPLNPRALEECFVNNNETLGRFVRQSQLEDPPYFGLSGADGAKNSNPVRISNGRESGPDTSGSMISPPETVASPPREAPPGIGAAATQDFRAATTTQDFQAAATEDFQAATTQGFRPTPGPSVPLPSYAPYQLAPQSQPVNPHRIDAQPSSRPSANPQVAAVRTAPGGPPEKAFRCAHPGCKSTFARNCELR